MLGVDLHTPLTIDERDALIDTLAKKAADRRLETVAVLFLEMHKPLSFLASQTALVAMPMLGPLLGAQSVVDLSKLLGNRNNIDLLISRIEDMAADNDKHDMQAAEKQG